MRCNTRGFTLIELVIVISIVGILAAIAFPSYQDSVRKSRRGQAQAVLLNMQIQQEKFRANNNTYTNNTTTLGAPASGVDAAKYYTFAVTGNTATAYTLTATAISGKGQENDKQGGTSCTPMSVDQSGTRLQPACWRR